MINWPEEAQAALVRVRISADALANDSPGAWADGKHVWVPKAVLSREHYNRGVVRLEALRTSLAADAAAKLRMHCAYTPRRPLAARLPVSYHRVPAPLRSLAAAAGARGRRSALEGRASFPGWPLDLSADFVADLAGDEPIWQTGPTPVLLTHDVDCPAALRDLPTLLDLEQEYGGRSATFVVPCGWRLDAGLLRELRLRGGELGTHGFDHSNRTPFMSAPEVERRLDAGLAALAEHHPLGYRSPSLIQTQPLVDALATRYRFDSSIATSGGLFPVAGTGCASARPFRLGGLIEIPVSLPRDGSLRFLGYSRAEILALWQQCSEEIRRAGGVVCLLTHPDRRFTGGSDLLRAYRDFVEWLASQPGFAFALPAEILPKVGPER
jgi:peptidoglycan/xylan/chitin deacetylase (PgdA/CDA1 family)